MDGHSLHNTLELLQFAHKNNIIVLSYPPHCTHALQGLDVVCFAKMKEAWKEEITAYKKRSGWAVKKEDFVEVFGKAFQRLSLLRQSNQRSELQGYILTIQQ